jgi:hypothetical protein
LPYATADTVASGDVAGVTMTSSNGIRCTGEKKCIPSTRSGCRAASAMRVIGIVLVSTLYGAAVDDRLDLLQHAMLEGEIFEYCFDDEITDSNPE